MVAETEPNDTIATAQFLNLGLDVGEEGLITISGSLTVTNNGYPTGFAVAEENVSLPTATDTEFTAGETNAIRYNSEFDVIAAQSFGADIDYFKVEAAAGQVITISSESSQGHFSPLVVVYDPVGNVLDFNDNDPRNRTFSSFLEFVVPATGDYYVAVQAYDTFHIDPFDPATVYSEFGNSQQALASTTIELSYHDFDFYSFDMEAGQVFAAAVDGVGTDLQLFDPFGKLVDLSTVSREFDISPGSVQSADAEDDVSMAAVAFETGTYTLRVSGNTTTDYEVEAGVFERVQVTVPLLDSEIFVVNTETEVSQTGSRIMVREDGGYAVIWYDNNRFFEPGHLDHYSIRFQNFDNDGEKIGSEVVIFDVDEDLYTPNFLLPGYPIMGDMALIELSASKLLFVYEVQIYASQSFQIFGRLLDSDGNALSSEDFVLSESELVADGFGVIVSPLDDGGFFHVYHTQDRSGWLAHAFDATGQKVGDEFSVPGDGDSLPVLTVIDNLNPVVLSVYSDEAGDSFVSAQTFDRAGQIIVSRDLFQVDPLTNPATAISGVVGLQNNKVAIYTSDDQVMVFDSELNLDFTFEHSVTAGTFEKIKPPELLALSDGGIAIFDNLGRNYSSVDYFDVVMTVYNHDGSKRSETLTVTNSNYEGRPVQVELLSNDKIVVTWDDFFADLTDNDWVAVHSRVIDPGVGPGHYVGSEGDDDLSGRQFNDLLEGGFGQDTLTGGLGRDTFMFAGTDEGRDNITDFATGEDVVEIGRSGFSYDLLLGELVASGFVAGTEAASDHAQFIYDQATGNLKFDADGNGSGNAVEIVNLGGGTALDASDIRIVEGDSDKAVGHTQVYTSSEIETLDPSLFMSLVKDYDGNNFGAVGSWIYQGQADIQNDGDLEYVFTNQALGRWATLGPDNLDFVDFDNHGVDGDTRVVGIYVDPLVADGTNEQGGPFDSQQRFQNDLLIDNLRLLAADDYDIDGYQEMYFRTVDGTSYLRALMHADGNIQYANYQSEQQMIDYLTAEGYDETTWGDWIV